jgi:hypothetical protein
MAPCKTQKFRFRIRTRSGVLVDNLSIHGRDEIEARRKLLQMYNGCEILETRSLPTILRGASAVYSYEDVVDMIVAG